jgi:hypothetical protein
MLGITIVVLALTTCSFVAVGPIRRPRFIATHYGPERSAPYPELHRRSVSQAPAEALAAIRPLPSRSRLG